MMFLKKGHSQLLSGGYWTILYQENLYECKRWISHKDFGLKRTRNDNAELQVSSI